MNTLIEEIPDKSVKNAHGAQAKALGRVLVADDDENLRSLAVFALSHSGYEVDVAENGRRAWQALHLKQYDLLVTDNRMPEMTGLQLVQQLQSVGFEIPVIIASGSLPSGLMAQNSPLKFAGILSKPYTLDELIKMVQGILSRSQLQHDPTVARTCFSTGGQSFRQTAII